MGPTDLRGESLNFSHQLVDPGSGAVKLPLVETAFDGDGVGDRGGDQPDEGEESDGELHDEWTLEFEGCGGLERVAGLEGGKVW